MRRLPYIAVAIVATAALLAGCNLPFLVKQDDTSVQTAAAETVQAQIGALSTATFTAVPFPSVPPANTPAPTNTVGVVNTLPPAATPTSNCDNAAFIADVTIPDNTTIGAGDTFTKTWRLKNAGVCSWTPSYAVVFVSGTSMAGPAVVALPGNVNPGQTVDLSVDLTAPATNGTYTGNWALRNAAGVIFSHFYVQIVVNSGSSGTAFAVTNVSFTVTGSCGAFHTTVSVTTNAAGTVNYHKVFSDGGSDTTPGTLTFTAAGTKSFTFDSSNSATSWIDIYVDSPNHQQFGRANFTCP